MAELPALTIHVHTALLVAFLTRVHILWTISAVSTSRIFEQLHVKSIMRWIGSGG